MRFIYVLASRHFTTYGPKTYDDKLPKAGKTGLRINGRLAFLAFSFVIGLLLVQHIYDALSMGEFSAYYCGGAALRNHLDPYQISSLHACEDSVVGVFHHNLFPGQTLPVMLPPFGLAVFSLISFMPPAAAGYFWLLVMTLSYAAILMMVWRASDMPAYAIAAATAIPILLVSLPTGQVALPLFALLLLAASAWRSGHVGAAVCAALGTLISPALGLPVCLTLALCDRAARIPLLIGGLLIAFIDVTVLPMQTTLYYLFTELPDHALAELHHDHQYSLSHVLTLVSVPPNVALVVGSVAYILMVVLGIIFAARLAREPRRRDLALLVPPTAAVFGGSTVHLWAIALTSLTAILVYREAALRHPVRVKTNYRIAAGIVAIGLPLEALRTTYDIALYLGISAVFIISLYKMSLRKICVVLAFICLICDGALIVLAQRSPRLMTDEQLSAVLQNAVKHGQSLEAVWRLYIESHYAWQGWVSVVLQLPVLCSVAFVLATVASISGGVQIRRLSRLPRN